MIIHCTYEELTALSAGADVVLAAAATCEETHVAAPPEVLAEVEALRPRLDGDLSVTTLAEAEMLERAVAAILQHLKERMDVLVLQQHVGADDAVNAYFDYAYVLKVHDRLHRAGQEMAAMIELMTGEPPTPESREEITFPD